RPIHCGGASRLFRWKDISADHTIGTIPNVTTSRTAGSAKAQPTTCSDCAMRRTFTPSRSPPAVGLARYRQKSVRLVGRLVQRILRARLPLDRRDERLTEGRRDPRVLRDLRARLQHVLQVLDEH